jgi:hypothetical protein
MQQGKSIMKVKNCNDMIALGLSAMFLVAIISGCNENSSNAGGDAIQTAEKDADRNIEKAVENVKEVLPATEIPFSCAACHDKLEPDPLRKELTDLHQKLFTIYGLSNETGWCLDCHEMNSLDSLNLAGGKTLVIKESHHICIQCHNEKTRAWEVGVHGKGIGDWNGRKEYLLRVPLDNPHPPKFKEITPEPPPARQEDMN